MRTIEEFRLRHLETLGRALERPGMYGGDSSGTARLLEWFLTDLCYIDEREADWDATAQYRMGNLSVFGHFRYQSKRFRLQDFTNEIASAYAEIACCLGYFTPKRLLAPDEFESVTNTVKWRWRDHNPFFDRDWTETELHELFGPPSHEVVGGYTTVACYGCEDRTQKWVFIDFARTQPKTNEWLPVPIARDVRMTHSNTMYPLPFAAGWLTADSREDADHPPHQAK
jgi:hypothetical protein